MINQNENKEQLNSIHESEDQELWIIDPEDLHTEDPVNDAENIADDEVIDYREVTEPTSLKATVIEMIVGMFLFGAVCELAGVWWVKDRLGCSIGLWLGIFMAAGMAAHMAFTFDRAVDMDEKSAENRIKLQAVLRYVIVVILFAIILFTKIANPLTAFLGIMSLKISAYLQPFIHTISRKMRR